MSETIDRVRERLGRVPAALECIEQAGQLAHYWPAIEQLLERSAPPPAAALEALLQALALHVCESHTCEAASCTGERPSPDSLPEFIVFFAPPSEDERQDYPVAATCCVCGSLRAKGTCDWYPRVLVQPLLPDEVLFSHGMCLECARGYELEVAS